MKKIYALILAALMILAIPTVAFATSGKLDIDLSKLSYDELVELKDQINLAIWKSEEWQEVTVPQGIWEVGKDIPEGNWTIRALPEARTYISVGSELRDNGTDVKSFADKEIKAEDYAGYANGIGAFKEGSDVAEWSFDLKQGQYVEVSSGSAIFSPYSGKPDLGFKK